MAGPQDRPEAQRALLRRCHLPPRHLGLHDPGRGPARDRYRRPRLRLRRRDPPRSGLQRPVQAGHGERRQAQRPRHQRLPVLHHRRPDPPPAGQAHDLRPGRGRRRPPGGRHHRGHPHGPGRRPGRAGGHREGHGRAGVTTSLPPEASQATEQVPVCPRHPDRVSYVRCQRCERPVCPECQRPAAVGVQCVDCVRQQSRGTRAARTVFGGLASRGRPVVTLTIMSICIGLFLLQWGTQDRVTEKLAFYPPLAIAEPYRFLTAAFLHSTSFLLHIVFNLYALWMVGPYLEGLLGRAQFAAVYLLSALGGSVGYYVLVGVDGDGWGTPTVGASGAVFGLFGALFVVTRRLGRSVGGIVAVLVINAVLGFVATG